MRLLAVVHYRDRYEVLLETRDWEGRLSGRPS